MRLLHADPVDVSFSSLPCAGCSCSRCCPASSSRRPLPRRLACPAQVIKHACSSATAAPSAASPGAGADAVQAVLPAVLRDEPACGGGRGGIEYPVLSAPLPVGSPPAPSRTAGFAALVGHVEHVPQGHALLRIVALWRQQAAAGRGGGGG
jgi:hypothetical protein